MQKINKHNYEAYLLDFIEGNLSAEEQHDLFVFLAEHPELKAAFEGDFGDVVLQPQNLLFDNKENLKVEEETALSLDTVEAWMIESVEGKLNAKQEQELTDFITTHHLQKTFLAYRSTRLKADTTIVYKNRQELKVSTGIVIPLYIRFAAAAAAVLIIGLAIGNDWFDPGPSPEATGLADFDQLKFSSPDQPEQTPVVAPSDQQPVINIAETGNLPVERRNNNADVITPQQEQMVEKTNVATKKDSLINALLDEDIPDDIVDNKNDKQEVSPLENDIAVTEAIASNPGIKSEQPYKLITDVASNVINKEIYFSRQKDVASNEYVAYQFKVGNFEFERKKSR